MTIKRTHGISPGAQRSALLALGRAAERRPRRKKLRRRKCLKNAQTPQRQVHAVLGVFLPLYPLCELDNLI
jgi:hypothetical protein